MLNRLAFERAMKFINSEDEKKELSRKTKRYLARSLAKAAEKVEKEKDANR